MTFLTPDSPAILQFSISQPYAKYYSQPAHPFLSHYPSRYVGLGHLIAEFKRYIRLAIEIGGSVVRLWLSHPNNLLQRLSLSVVIA